MTAMTAMPRTIIIGGGLSGLCLAHGLTRAGADVVVCERDTSADVRGQGYRLTIDEVGSAALHACLPESLYEFIRATSSSDRESGEFLFLDAQAREIARFTFDNRERERRGEITGQVDRKSLRQALLSGLPNLRFGKKFTRYELLRNSVRVQFEDGTSDEAELLVGADGTNSAVRRQLLPKAIPRDTGIRAIFGRTWWDDVTLPALRPLLERAGLMMLGPNGVIFFATAMRFVQPSETRNYVMWAVAARDAGLCASLDPVALRDVALRKIAGYDADVARLVGACDPQETVLVPIRAMTRVAPWSAPRVTLVGDAIHAMPPFGAHGANTALRDAKLLADRLSADHSRGVFSLDARVASYQREMLSYSHRVVRQSLGMMTMANAKSPFKRVLLRTLLRFIAARQRA
jgi:2-polyprenyl-6-methoxyphenol hydroxylase-like FAD-dependent oxidoreductase